MTIRIHHLNDSRSQRILWLLEELALPYEIVRYQRDPVTNLAPPELEAVHPLGKSPLVEADGALLHESGAIVDILVRRHGKGVLAPPEGSPDRDSYLMWLHYAEGSAMLPLMLRLYTSRLGAAAEPLAPRLESETARHLGWIDSMLQDRAWLVGDALTGADIQMSMVGEAARAWGLIAPYPAIAAWVQRFQARPAYRRALDAGGPYQFA
ncbi:glutathione S-transferase family protein [Sandaracinobacteroides sp. A072]|uniref:glutathione S-transferase family protein n=1 Tax=Sandaracinobacteroides sp. A072 TaxID=3461146 RepID=UPI004043361C